MSTHERVAVAVMAILAVAAVAVLWHVTTPNLDDLPAYDCVPGHHHTTKECAQ